MGKAANKSTCHGTEQQEARDEKGRWKPGRSGNPSGPKPGASCRALMMARAWAEAKGLPLLMSAAEGGDVDALKTLVMLGVPRQKSVSLPLSLPGKPEEILEAMADGEVDPSTAQEALGAHLTAARVKEISELEARLTALEAALAAKEK